MIWAFAGGSPAPTTVAYAHQTQAMTIAWPTVDGSSLDDFMPWRSMCQMVDAEPHALWVYLRSLPPQPTRR